MYKVWSPYGFNTDFDPFSVVRIHSRGIDSQWSKQANVYSPLLDQFDNYKVQPGHTLIWIAPVAESSRYSCNVNGDGFCKSACENYHQTFLNGHKFSEHEHHDPSIATGRPVASAYNDRMGRIEILVDIDNVKNASIVDSLEKGQQTKWSMACFCDENTPVLTSEGYKPISKIVPGDLVLTHKNRYRRVKSCMKKSYTGKQYKIKCKGQPISLRVTEDHPFLVKSKVFAGNMKPENTWTEAKDLNKGETLFVNSKPFFSYEDSIENVNLAKLLGVYLAEGYKGKNYISFTVNVGDKSRQYIKELAKELFNKEAKEYKHNRSDKAVNIFINSKEVSDNFSSLCGDSLKNKRVPLNIKNAEVEVKKSFIGGWFDGDGFYTSKGASWSTNKLTLALELRDLLLSLGIASSIAKLKHKKSYGSKSNNAEYVVTVAKADCKELLIYSDKENKYHDETWETAKRYINKSSLYIEKENEASCRIEKIEEDFVENKVVYDISVEEDESFTAAGIVTHNCKIDYDVCNVCGNKATKPQGPMPSDTDREALDTPSPGYCKHAREHLGAIYSDGHRVFVDNPHPNFFDISSVGTPAEVIAQTTFFRKAASAKIASGQTGYDLATLIGLNDNERFLASLPASYRKKSNILTKMSAMEKEIPFEVISLKDSCEKEDKEKIKKLKENKKAAYSQLRKNDIILSFEAWATLEGVDSNPAVKEASQKLPKMFTYLKEIYKDGDVLNNGSYDYVEASNNLKVAAIVSDIVPSCSMKSANVKTRMFNFDNKKLRNYNNDSIVSPAAENLLTKYASYVLSELGSKDNTFLNQAINLTLLRNLVEY